MRAPAEVCWSRSPSCAPFPVVRSPTPESEDEYDDEQLLAACNTAIALGVHRGEPEESEEVRLLVRACRAAIVRGVSRGQKCLVKAELDAPVVKVEVVDPVVDPVVDLEENRWLVYEPRVPVPMPGEVVDIRGNTMSKACPKCHFGMHIRRKLCKVCAPLYPKQAKVAPSKTCPNCNAKLHAAKKQCACGNQAFGKRYFEHPADVMQ